MVRSYGYIIAVTDTKLVSSNEAARAVGMNGATLNRAVKDRKLIPTVRTPGGHNRWDLDDLRRQLVLKPAVPASERVAEAG